MKKKTILETYSEEFANIHREKGEYTLTELANELDMPPSTLKARLERDEKAGKVKSRRALVKRHWQTVYKLL